LLVLLRKTRSFRLLGDPQKSSCVKTKNSSFVQRLPFLEIKSIGCEFFVSFKFSLPPILLPPPVLPQLQRACLRVFVSGRLMKRYVSLQDIYDVLLRLQEQAHAHNLIVASYEVVRNDINFFK